MKTTLNLVYNNNFRNNQNYIIWKKEKINCISKTWSLSGKDYYWNHNIFIEVLIILIILGISTILILLVILFPVIYIWFDKDSNLVIILILQLLYMWVIIYYIRKFFISFKYHIFIILKKGIWNNNKHIIYRKAFINNS